MESLQCMWIFQINNCKENKQLNIINIIGITYMSFIVLILLNTYIYLYKKEKQNNLLGKLNFGLLISFLIRIFYLILLYIENINIVFLCILQDLGWILFIGTFNLLLYDMVKLLEYNKNIDFFYMKKVSIFSYSIYISSIFYIFPFLCSLISGLLFYYKNERAYIFLGIQFIIWGIIVFYVGFFFYFFLIEYNKKLKKILNTEKNNCIIKKYEEIKTSIKKIKIITYIVIPNVIVFPLIWIYQGIHMYFMQKIYSWNIIVISLLWYWLAMSIGSTFCVFLLIYHIYHIYKITNH